jgi:hypothetical protein
MRKFMHIEAKRAKKVAILKWKRSKNHANGLCFASILHVSKAKKCERKRDTLFPTFILHPPAPLLLSQKKMPNF